MLMFTCNASGKSEHSQVYYKTHCFMMCESLDDSMHNYPHQTKKETR